MADKEKTQSPPPSGAPQPIPPGLSSHPPAVNTPADAAHSDAEMPKIAPGELEPGQEGYLVLDDVGAPVGEPIEVPPMDGTPFTRVRATPQAVYDDVTTPTGAPITPMMNPVPSLLMDAAFLERNPIPDEVAPKTPKQAKTVGKDPAAAPKVAPHSPDPAHAPPPPAKPSPSGASQHK